MALRLKKVFQSEDGSKQVKIYFSSEWEEFVVITVIDGSVIADSSYFADDWQAAVDKVNFILNRL